MALNTQNVTPYERSSQFYERRRSLFPQNSIDSGEDSDLGCMSPLSNSSFDDNDDLLPNRSYNNIDDYDVIGIVRREISNTPEITPYKDDQSITTPNLKNSKSILTSALKDVSSETNILKTPHDTVTSNTKLPKLSHKSVTDSCSSAPSKRKLSPYNSPEIPNKSSKVDFKNSKVRTTLFPEIDLFLPTKKFYSNTDSSLLQNKENKKEFDYYPKMDQIMKSKISVPCSSVHTRRKYSSKRSSAGKINAGVKHKIRKPRQKKNISLPLAKSSMNEVQSNALKYYLENLRELKTTNEKKNLIVNKENTSPEVAASVSSVMEFSTAQGDNNISFENNVAICPNIDFSFTKITQNVPTVPQNISKENQFLSNSLSTNVNEHFDSQFQGNQISNNNNNFQFSTNPFATTLTFSNQISCQPAVDRDLCKKRPLSPTNVEPDQSKKFFKFSRGHKGVVNMNESIKIVVDHGKVSLLGSSTPKKSQQQQLANFESEDFAIEEPIMSQVVMDNILSTLEDDAGDDSNTNLNQTSLNPESHIHLAMPSTSTLNLTNTLQTPGSIVAASTNPANLILSPISQMCDVTSGLALNSPKRAKNLSLLMDNVTRSTRKELLLSPKGNLVGKKKPLTLTQRKIRKLHKDQMLLDAGQKKFGVTECPECNFVYHIGDPSDEACHMNYHEAVPVLKFNGWKNERVVADFQKMGRIIQIKPGDPKLWLKRASNIMEVIDREIGCYKMEFALDNSQIFLYIKNRLIAGCLVAVPTSIGYKMLTVKAHETDLCSERCFPVKCGIARIWVSQHFRKQGIGTALMNALKKNFFYGYILNNNEIAFSSPTEMGKAFAKKYFGTSNFMIYFP